MAKDLYRKSIQVDGDGEADDDAVRFRPFVGVSPKRYLELFAMKPRKNAKGHIVEWSPAQSGPRIGQIIDYVDAETAVLERVATIQVILELPVAERRAEESNK